MDEMERLKRLILIGKTPLQECPPELYHHPVFVFWRMVNKEVAKASKKRADAYYRKLKSSQRVEQVRKNLQFLFFFLCYIYISVENFVKVNLHITDYC